MNKHWDGQEHGHWGSDTYEFCVVENEWDDTATWNNQPSKVKGISSKNIYIGKQYR